MTREGFTFVLPALGISLVLFAIWALSSLAIVLALGGIFFFLTLFLIFFFRDPERKTPGGENLVLSSADGKIISIKPFPSVDFVEGKGTLVSVFMSVFDVHVNRAPISGKVEHFKYNPGRFFPAFQDKASLENEQTELGFQNAHGRVMIKQIAGIIARRIVCRVRRGDKLRAGQRFGLIKFGSRVDHLLPENVEVRAGLDQKVRAGETIIGVFKE
ncbi:MAG: phosphatidylserine decarboxylase family protein [Candidatus Zixiibacteriota bacterium]|nr:MAG: phosphatidylserine decarboxylase family protein [candidate division Zixibacteria bacterium]